MRDNFAEIQGWQLRLFGEFSLTDPAGQTVRLPDRKTEGLLAILALTRDYGIERQAAADILWPLRAPQNRANLRQALSVLRRTLGAEWVESSVHHCRLTSGAPIVSDYERAELRSGGGFMPGHDGDWFEDVRLEAILGRSQGDDEASIHSSFNALLEWYASRDSGKLLGLMRTDKLMVQALPYASVSRLMSGVPNTPEHAGWKAFWMAHVSQHTASCQESTSYYRRALRSANGDRQLMVACTWNLFGMHIIQNDLNSAWNMVEVCKTLASESNDRDAVARAKIGQGLILLHSGEHKLGLDYLHDGEKLLVDGVELTIRRPIRAFLEATFGDINRAEESLAEACATPAPVVHPSFELFVTLAKVGIAAGRGPGPQTGKDLERLIAISSQRGYRPLEVYGNELAAKISLVSGHSDAARVEMNRSRSLRRDTGMTYTAWDRMRLQEPRANRRVVSAG